MTSPRPPGTVAVAAGVGLAVAATLWLVLWPCSYVGVTAVPADPVGPAPAAERVCASLIAANGWWVLGLLSVPVALTVVGLLASLGGIGWLVWGVAAVLLGFCVIGAFSVGLYYAPSVVALVVAAVRVGQYGPRRAEERWHPESP
jgi:hypothetical protein